MGIERSRFHRKRVFAKVGHRRVGSAFHNVKFGNFREGDFHFGQGQKHGRILQDNLGIRRRILHDFDMQGRVPLRGVGFCRSGSVPDKMQSVRIGRNRPACRPGIHGRRNFRPHKGEAALRTRPEVNRQGFIARKIQEADVKRFRRAHRDMPALAEKEHHAVGCGKRFPYRVSGKARFHLRKHRRRVQHAAADRAAPRSVPSPVKGEASLPETFRIIAYGNGIGRFPVKRTCERPFRRPVENARAFRILGIDAQNQPFQDSARERSYPHEIRLTFPCD